MRILALTRYDRLGSSSRVRFYQYYPYLKAHGVQIVSAPFFGDEYVRGIYTGKPVPITGILSAYFKRLSFLVASSSYDLLWLEKELFPWMPSWFEDLLFRMRIPYAVDYDDAVYHRYDMHPAAPVRALLGRKIDRVMQRAALVIVGNETLADRANRAGAKRVEQLPSVVDVGRYKVKTVDIESPLRIGWIGSPVTAPYLNLVREALEILAHQTDIHLTLIGSGSMDLLEYVPATILPWTEELELSIGEMFDVGIMPLVDGPFERGKCGYKLVQYMAAGLPVVASPVGINKQFVIPGDNGYLAASTGEWLEALQKLSRDAELRLKMGQSGRHQAEQMYNLQGTAPKLLALLSSARKA